MDPSVSEELCSVGSAVIAISKSKFSTVLQVGSGSLHPQTLLECLKMGQKVGQKLNEALSQTLSETSSDTDEVVGFLR